MFRSVYQLLCDLVSVPVPRNVQSSGSLLVGRMACDAPNGLILAAALVGAFTVPLVWPGSTACAAGPAFQVVAGQRQLFLDDVRIAEIVNLTRTMHQPSKKGAVIRPIWHDHDPKALARGDANAIIRTAPVLDTRDNILKIWLLDSTCYQSRDGLHWQHVGKPNLPVNKVVYDDSDPDPGRCYKAFLPNRGFAASPDGMTWKMLDVPKIASGDESNFSFDSKAHLFIVTVKHGGPYGRSVLVFTSKDFKQWTKSKLDFHTDELDQELGLKNIEERLADATLQPMYYKPNPAVYNVDVYNMGVFGYEGFLIGMPAMYHAVGKEPRYPNTEGFQLIQLMCSRDLESWKRLGQRRSFIGPSPMGSGAYDLTQIMPPSSPLIRGDDELWFYYWGGKYRGGWKWVGPYGDWTPTADGRWNVGYWTVEDDFHPDPDVGAVCLAVLRRDGFVSLDAEERFGSVITRPIRIPGRRLFVNVDSPDGELRAGIVNASGGTVEGLGIEDCVPVRGDHKRAEITWNGNPDLWPLTSKDVQIRFRLKKGSLYSYWFEDEVPAARFLVIKDDFENSHIGAQPRLASTHTERKGDSIGVTDQMAAGGERCLKVTDAPGLSNRFNPHFYYEPDAREGIVHCSFDLRLGEGVEMIHTWRGKTGTGPRFLIQNGSLQVAGSKLLDVPGDRWMRIDVVTGLGSVSTTTWELTVTPRGGEAQHFADLRYADPNYQTLGYLGFISNASDKSVFYLDNIELVPVADHPKRSQ